MSAKSGNECAEEVVPFLTLRRIACTSCSECSKGRGRSSTALTTEKMAVFAPTPSAVTRIATAVKPGLFDSTRTPNLKSCHNVFIVHPFLKRRVTSDEPRGLAGHSPIDAVQPNSGH